LNQFRRVVVHGYDAAAQKNESGPMHMHAGRLVFLATRTNNIAKAVLIVLSFQASF